MGCLCRSCPPMHRGLLSLSFDGLTLRALRHFAEKVDNCIATTLVLRSPPSRAVIELSMRCCKSSTSFKLECERGCEDSGNGKLTNRILKIKSQSFSTYSVNIKMNLNDLFLLPFSSENKIASQLILLMSLALCC